MSDLGEALAACVALFFGGYIFLLMASSVETGMMNFTLWGAIFILTGIVGVVILITGVVGAIMSR